MMYREMENKISILQLFSLFPSPWIRIASIVSKSFKKTGSLLGDWGAAQ